MTVWQAGYGCVRAVHQRGPVVVDAGMIFWFAVAAGHFVATVEPLRVGLRKMETFEF